MTPVNSRILRGFVVVAGCMLACLASAQGYPNRPIKFIVGFPPGGGNDVVARIVAQHLSEPLGQQVIVENRAGATGTVAANVVAKSPPDGYTLLAGAVSTNAIAPSLYLSLAYDQERDLSPVTLLASIPQLIAIHPSLEIRSVRELIDYAKANPGKLHFASAGNGSTPHITGEIFKLVTGTDLVHVPYKGAGDSTAATIAGQVHLIFSSPSALMPQVKAGRLRALGVTSARRLPVIPEVPSIAETGLAGYEVNNCYGILVPAKTPDSIVRKLNADIVRILRQPEMISHLESLGFDVLGTTPGQFTAFAQRDLAKWARDLKAAGIKPQ